MAQGRVSFKKKQAQHGRMWQRANGFFHCTAHMFVEPQKETYLCFIKNFFEIQTSLRSNKNIYKYL